MSQRERPTLVWDIFCHVIDNWGDLGVCWRLATHLAKLGQRVRLWADDTSPLQWMATGALEGRFSGIDVHTWPRADATAPPPKLPPGDVLIEAFGCEIDPAWVEALHPTAPTTAAQRCWINLEYLSAEPYVARCHRLASPISSGPLRGRQKWFFYPGFTAGTGGLLREANLLHKQAAFDPAGWQAAQGWSSTGEGPKLALFCYEPAALHDCVRLPALRHAHWWVTAGRAQAAMAAAWDPSLPNPWQALPHLDQNAFDQLLWAADLNFVRGEDSLVRALWARKPFIWHIYPQEDQAHHDKLDAFLDWLDAPASLRAFHRRWNGIEPGKLPAPDWPAWRDCAQRARDRLLAQRDLATQLLDFVMEKR